MGSMIINDKYITHGSEVRRDVIRPSNGTNTSRSEDKYILKSMTLDSNDHTHETENSFRFLVQTS